VLEPSLEDWLTKVRAQQTVN